MLSHSETPVWAVPRSPSSCWAQQCLCPTIRSRIHCDAREDKGHQALLMTAAFFFGGQPCACRVCAFLYPSGADSHQCLHPGPPLQVIGICSQFFACTAGCPVKLQVGVVGPWWAAGLQATNTCACSTFPCCVSLPAPPHPDIAIPTLAFPLHFSVLPQTWISDAMKNKHHPSQLFIFHLTDPTTHHRIAG